MVPQVSTAATSAWRRRQDPVGAFDAECQRNCQCASRIWSLCQCDTCWAYLVWNHSRMRNLKSGFAKWKIYTDAEWVKVAQLCPTHCDPMDSTVHGILQARLLEWAAFPFSRGSFQPRDQIQVSHIAGRFFTRWATREAQLSVLYLINVKYLFNIWSI